MATYLELMTIRDDGDFQKRVSVACYVAANTIRSESAATQFHAERMVWAKRVFEGGGSIGLMVWIVLVNNAQYTQAQILASTDAVLQTAVDNAVNLFAVG